MEVIVRIFDYASVISYSCQRSRESNRFMAMDYILHRIFDEDDWPLYSRV